VFREGWAEVNASSGGLRRLHDGGGDKQGQDHPDVGWICCECVAMQALKSNVLRVTADAWPNRPDSSKQHGGSGDIKPNHIREQGAAHRRIVDKLG
jgi:hypothetical protein